MELVAKVVEQDVQHAQMEQLVVNAYKLLGILQQKENVQDYVLINLNIGM